jgi:hypothetical protein
MAVAAMLWALAFASVHIAWAFGWYVGLDAVAAKRAFSRPWFLYYDVAVAAGCLVTGGACALVAVGRRPNPTRVAKILCVGAAVIVCARAGGGLCAIAWRAATSGRPDAIWWELWFLLGAVVLTGSVLRSGRPGPRRSNC